MNTSHQDVDSLLLTELAAQTPRFPTNLTSHFSPMLSQGEIPSSISGTMNAPQPGNGGVDLLDDQHWRANDANLLGYFILMPSPRQSTLSPETHQLYQALCSSCAHFAKQPL